MLPPRQDLERMAEADAVMVLHELDRVARFAARHAVPQPHFRRDDEVRFVRVAVERAQPLPVLAAVLGQFDAPAPDQGEEIGFPLDPIDFRFRDARHGFPPFSKTPSR